MCMCGADYKFVACPPSLVAGACVSAAVCGLKGESWCRTVRLHAILRDVTSADTVSCLDKCNFISLRNDVTENGLLFLLEFFVICCGPRTPCRRSRIHSWGVASSPATQPWPWYPVLGPCRSFGLKRIIKRVYASSKCNVIVCG